MMLLLLPVVLLGIVLLSLVQSGTKQQIAVLTGVLLLLSGYYVPY